jgi:hypothetical protein
MSYYQYYYATVQAKDFDQATEKAQALEMDDCKRDDYVEWEVYSIEEKVPRSLTAEEQAFVEVETAPQVFERRTIKLGLSDGINI